MNNLQAPSNLPPPYRAPPHNMAPGPPTPKAHAVPGQAPYSRFNTSEPHLAGQYKSSPVPGYRHTINHENSSSVQTNLKQMLAAPKHNTLDIHSQNLAIQHLRNQGVTGDRGPPGPGPGQYPYNGLSSGAPGPDSSYGGPDSLRNTANKMFSRGQSERSSGLNGQPPQPPYTGYPPQPQAYGHNNNNNSVGHNTSLNQSLNHSVDMGYQGQETRGQRIRQDSAEDPNKRNSYAPFTGNQSFRAAVIQSPGPQPAPARPGSRQPPQVPPKPGSRSREASRERPRDEENDHLETELKNILRGNNKEFDKNNGPGTPPLPALSPGQSANQTPQSSPDFRAKYKMHQTPSNLNNRPDLLENENLKKMQERPMPGHKTGPLTQGRRPEGSNLASAGPHGPPGKDRLKDPRARGATEQGQEQDIASTTTGLDLESVMALQTDLTSDEELSTTIDLSDAQAIRKQLDGLENMYTEVLKLLGLRKFGRPPANGDVKTGIARRKMYGSMSSLPSVSSIGNNSVKHESSFQSLLYIPQNQIQKKYI